MRHFYTTGWLPGLLLLLQLLSAGALRAQVPSFEWATACGSAVSADFGVGASQVAVDAQGNTYVLGSFAGTITLGSTTLTAAGSPTDPLYQRYDLFIAKLNPQGQYEWAVRAGGDKNDTGAGLAVDAAGGVYVTGQFSSYSLSFGTSSSTIYNSSAGQEVFVAKLSALDGQGQWARRAGGTGQDTGRALAINAQGEVCLAGFFFNPLNGAADFGSTSFLGKGVFVAKLTSAGAWLWAVQGSYAIINSLTTDAASNIYLAGYFDGTAPVSVTFGSTTLIGVRTPTYDVSAGDGFVAKLNVAGTWGWAVQGDVTGHNLLQISDLAADGQGHLYVCGAYQGAAARLGSFGLPNLSGLVPPPTPAPPIYYPYYYSDAFVAQLDAASGTWQWAVRTGGSASDNLGSVAADSQGRVYVGGGSLGYHFPVTFQNPLPGATGPVTAAQLDGATGAWRWASSAVGGVLAVGPAGKVYMASSFAGTSAPFGSSTVSGPGPYTGVVARLGAGPLAARTGAGGGGGLQVWPNPSVGRQVRVAGPGAGELVQVLDVLGRAVYTARMPGSGALELALPAALPAGVYVVRGGGLAQQLVVQ